MLPVNGEPMNIIHGNPARTYNKGMSRSPTAAEDREFDVLPVEAFRETVLHHLHASSHQVLICVGETGSGKSTKIPQIVLDSGLLDCADVDGSDKLSAMAVTQPRRVGAVTVSQRVASERGGRIGDEVGYKVRFDDHTGPDTRIIFMTDGILVSYAQNTLAFCYMLCLILCVLHNDRCGRVYMTPS